MSLGIYPVFQPTLAGSRFEALGEVLAANYEILDEIAMSANLTPFTAFADNRAVPDDFGGDPDELAEIMGEWDEWFNPADGAVAMQALADHLSTNPEAAAQCEQLNQVIEELQELTRVLELAASQVIQFRLEMC